MWFGHNESCKLCKFSEYRWINFQNSRGKTVNPFKYLSVLLAVGIFGLFTTSCQSSANNTSVNRSADQPAANTTENKPVATPTQAVLSGPVGSLATPTEAYKTAYELRKKKDIEGLKKIMSKDILEFFTEIGQEEKKSLDDMLRDLADKPQADRAEVRNEKITGNWAVLEYLDEKGEWKTMDFEKVDGKWLLSFPKADSPGNK